MIFILPSVSLCCLVFGSFFWRDMPRSNVVLHHSYYIYVYIIVITWMSKDRHTLMHIILSKTHDELRKRIARTRCNKANRSTYIAGTH
mmetsp:Transcript_1423/g.2591  ORF Transcript_1423/g.2591 Transcript_1423/m.2591 type:complete len:88 (+) Transcript_1423:255-518(+)